METNTVLGAMLAVQATLGVATWWASSEPVTEASKLVPMAENDVTAFEVDGGGSTAPVRLERDGAGWKIASAGDYPAQKGKVDKVLSSLVDVEVRAPVATGGGRLYQLSVAGDHYTKKVKLQGGTGEAVLYLGTAAGDRSWVRREGEDTVYAARGVSTWSVGSNPRAYYDSALVQADPGSLETFEIRAPDHEVALQRGDDGSWTLSDGTAVDQDKVGTLLKKALGIRIAALPDGAPQGLDGGVRVDWTVQGADEDAWGGYTIGDETDGKRFVAVDGNDHPVLVADAALKDVLEPDL